MGIVAPSSYASTGRSTRREKSNYTTVRYRLRCKGNPQEKSRWYSTAFAVRGTPRKNLNSSDNLRFPVTAHCNLHSVGVSDSEASSMTVLVASADPWIGMPCPPCPPPLAVPLIMPRSMMSVAFVILSFCESQASSMAVLRSHAHPVTPVTSCLFLP